MIRATKKDIPTLIKILSTPFFYNNSVNRCIKKDNKKQQRIENQIKYVSNISIKNNMAFINDSLNGAVLGVLSNGIKATLWDNLFFLFKVSGVKLGLNLIKREKILNQVSQEKNYFHLWFIGVCSEMQGQGAGSQMLSDIKIICREKSLPIYLETSNKRNLVFYERNGFKLYKKMRLPMDDFDLYFFKWNPEE